MGDGCDRVDGLGREKERGAWTKQKEVAESPVKKVGQNRLIIF